MAGFAAEKPSGENRVRAFEEPGQGEWSTRGEERDDRLAQVKNRLGERALPPRQPEIGATCGLSAHRRRLSEAEHHQLGIAAEIDGGGDAARVVSGYIDPRSAVDPAPGQCGFEPLPDGYGLLSTARRSPWPQHFVRRRGQGADKGDAPYVGGQQATRRAHG